MTTLADDATELSKEYYRELVPRSTYVPESFVDPSLGPRLEASGRYALSDEAINTASQLERTGIRAVGDQARSTLIYNVEQEKGKWYRIPSPTACGFCRLLATRGPVYKSEHAACASHDKCKCKVAVVRPGMTHETPEYMHSWNNDYRKYRRETINAGLPPSLDNIVNAWNRGIRAELRSLGVDESHLDVA